MSMNHHLELLDATVHETYAWLNDIEAELGLGMGHRVTLQMLRACLHALRDQLTVEQSAHLAAQLPTLIRGMYFEGWKPSATPVRDRHLEMFIDRMRPGIVGIVDDLDLYDVARAVLHVLQSRVSPGEAEKVTAALPKGLRELLI